MVAAGGFPGCSPSPQQSYASESGAVENKGGEAELEKWAGTGEQQEVRSQNSREEGDGPSPGKSGKGCGLHTWVGIYFVQLYKEKEFQGAEIGTALVLKLLTTIWGGKEHTHTYTHTESM